MRSRRWNRVLGLSVVLCVGSFPAVFGQPCPGVGGDCNGNGIPDDCDILPSFNFLSADLFPKSGLNAIDVTAAHFNGDLKIDVAVPCRNSNEVSIFTNVTPAGGEADFMETDTLSVGTQPWDVIAVEFDGINGPDLFTVNRTSQDISMLLNNGIGSFFTVIPYLLTFQPFAIEAADVDNQNGVDLIVVGGDDDLYVLRNDGAGLVAQEDVYSIPGFPNDVAAADLNNDLAVDLVITLPSADRIAVAFNDGTGNFVTPAPTFPAGSIPACCVVVPLDADNFPDVAVTNFANPGLGPISILRNNGNETFAPPVAFGGFTAVSDLAAADLDDDGDNDLVTVTELGGRVFTLRNNGAGSFLEIDDFPAGGLSFRIAVADVDGDDDNDILSANGNSKNFGVLAYEPTAQSLDVNEDGTPDECELDCNGNSIPDLLDLSDGPSLDCNGNDIPDECDISYGFDLREPPLLIGIEAANSIDLAAGDFDGDGIIDVASANNDSSNVSILKNNDNETFTTLPAKAAVGQDPNFIIAADLDQQGLLDLATSNSGSNDLSLLRSTGGGGFTVTSLPLGFQPFGIAALHLNSNVDNRLDLVTVGGAQEGAFFLSAGGGLFGNANNFFTGPNPNSVAVGDLDGNGTEDVLVGLFNTTFFVWHSSDGNGALGPAIQVPAGNSPVIVHVGDIDGNHAVDVVTANFGSNDLCVMLNNGGANFQAPVCYDVEPTPFTVECADLNRDGRLDLATTTEADGTLSVLLQNRDGTFQAPRTFNALGAAFRVLAVDLDEDDLPELVTANGRDHQVAVFFNDSVLPVSEDCNEDGVPDECQGGPFDCMPEGDRQLPADCNQDGVVDLSDVVCLLGHFFQGDPEFLPCSTAAGNLNLMDSNDDAAIDLSDAIYLLAYLFQGGSPPEQGVDCTEMDCVPNLMACP